ncbi:unnamed protein product [Agarophyton chilense]
MIKKLGERYDSRTEASRIVKMVELISLRYSSVKIYIGKHIDRMREILEKPEARNTIIPPELETAILIASLDASELIPITGAFGTLPD